MAKGFAMSSIGSIGSSGLAGFIQGLTSSKNSVNTASNFSSSAVDTLGKLIGGTKHRKAKAGGAFLQKIQQAVTSALQNPATNGTATTVNSSSSTSADPNKAITNAILQVLKSANSAGTTDNDGDSASDSTSASDNADTTAQSFLQLLQAHGITPEQFKTDFQTAVQESQATLANPLKPGNLQASPLPGPNLPVGALIDAVG